MKKKRFKAILAIILAASMVLGSGVTASADEISANSANHTESSVSGENTVSSGTKENAGETKKEEIPESGNMTGTVSEQKSAVSENVGEKKEDPDKKDGVSKDSVSKDSVSEDTVSSNDGVEAQSGEEENNGAATVSVNLSVTAETVSYNGEKQKISISSDRFGNGCYFDYAIISADKAAKPSDCKDFSKGYRESLPDVSNVKKTFTVSAVNAGKYAVSVNAYYMSGVSGNRVVSNNVIFLRIDPAGEVSVSVNGLTKHYDGKPISASDNKPFVVKGKGTLYGKDLDLIRVTGSRTDAGTGKIDLDVSKIRGNYSKVNVSSGSLVILSTNLVITSKDYFKHYDGKRVENAARQGFAISSTDEGVDVKALSSNLGLKLSDFDWAGSSLISGDEISVSDNKFKLSAAKEKELKDSLNFASIKYVYGKIHVKKHNWTSNNLSTPVITSVKMNNKGWITVNFKAVKTWKNKATDNTKKNTARYMIYRYDDVNQDWILLNGNNTTNAKKKEEEITLGQTGKSFVDKEAGRLDSSTYVYKVNVIGYDESGTYGMSKNPSYKLCQAIPLEVSTKQKDGRSLDFEFSKIRGAEKYTVERSYSNKKDSFSEIRSEASSSIKERPYSGTRLVSAKSYKDNGQLAKKGEKLPAEAVYITDSPVDENSYYYYRVKATAKVTDFDEGGKLIADKITVESDMSPSLKGRNAVCPPDVLSAASVKYNQGAIVFEKLSSNDIMIGSSKECNKYKYQIMRSTKIDGSYSVVKTITGRQLDGDIEGLKEFKKGTFISVNGLNYTAAADCYMLTVTNLKPEVTYYYRVKAVRNNIAGAMGNYMPVRPVLADVTHIEAENKNYNQITISTNEIEGATQMVITYRAIKDNSGRVLSANTSIESKWTSKTFSVKKDAKTKKPVMQFVVGGLKHGYTYTFYAEPKNGNKHETPEKKRVYATEKTRPGKPIVKASPKSLTEINIEWQTVPGANEYVLEIYDAEDTSKDKKPIKTQTFKKAGKHTWKGGNNGVIDGKTKASDIDVAGKPYTFVVTAMRKDSYYKNGNVGDPSEGVTEAGRPTAPTNLKAAVNSVNADAKLTWTACKDNTKDTPITYMIEREVYKYKVGTADSFEKNSTSSNINDYKSNYKKVSYSSSTRVMGSAFSNGDKVIYKVTPVYNSKITGRGQNKDGYILGVPAKVTYITPYSITVGARNEVTVGGSLTVPISYKPTSTTAKAVNWMAAGNNDYFTQAGANITGKKSTGDWNNGIYVQAISKANGIASNTGLVKVNAKAVSSSLKVCIDAGHGGEDSGATYSGMLEKSCNLDMAYAMKSRLEAYGVNVVMTRYDDSYLTVGARPEVAYNNGCNLFVSIHCNSGGAQGTEVYKSVSQYHDDELASKILGKITSSIGTNSRGVKTRTGSNGDYYGVIRGAAARGINGMIVEVAFMDGDYSKLANSANRQAAGTAIADAILEKYGYK